MQVIDKVLYWFAQNLALVILYYAMFQQGEKRHSFLKLVQIIALNCVQMVCSAFVEPIFTQIVIMAAFYSVLQLVEKRARKAVIIQVALTYAIKEFARLVCSGTALFACLKELGVRDDLVVTINGIVLLILFCIISVYLLKEKDFTPVSQKYRAGLCAVALVGIFTFLGIFQVPYGAISNDSLFILLLVLVFCYAVLVSWAHREQGVHKQTTELTGQLEDTSRECDNLREENHAMKKDIPELKFSIQALAKWKRGEDAEVSNEAAEMMMDEETAAMALYRKIVPKTTRVDTDTGIPILSNSIKFVRREAEKAGVRFGCIITHKLTPILDLADITEGELQDILRNLLDNAVHAAAKASHRNGMVQCVMGKVNGCYGIEIYDSGDLFPPEILSNLGKMGNTTDGSGIGLASVLKKLARCNASFSITHFEKPQGTGATKCVAITFDGEARAHLPGESKDKTPAISISSLLDRNKGRREN